MSGFVLAYGAPDAAEVERMFSRIRHRGPYLSGTYANGKTVLAQNLLQADCPGVAPESAEVPVVSERQPSVRLGYDGQMGNARRLAASLGLEAGPFLEEQVVLGLYHQHGVALFDKLDDAVFSFALIDDGKLLAARDVLGIKTLFYGFRDDTLLLASELKSLMAVTDQAFEFPPGHSMDETGELTQFASLPSVPVEPPMASVEVITAKIRDIIDRSVRNRVDFRRPTACLLSGGMDSSVITYHAAQLLREVQGPSARLKTLAVGTSDSGDLASARVMAAHVGTDHEEVLIDLEQALDVLPEVIYQLESFDPSLVRSTVSNYIISRHASRQGFEVLLSGEGGDEIFCGYLYLKDTPTEDLFSKQMECLGYLHNNASLRLDRANLSNSVQVVAPLISGELFRCTLRIPSEYKQWPAGDTKVEKWIFRKAFEKVLPESITQRLKQEFSQGSGLASLLPEHFERTISDDDFERARAEHPFVRSKEELHYYRLFAERFPGDHAVATVGQWPFL
jgi:asparagine synthase (glutamine-hydrolysing)